MRRDKPGQHDDAEYRNLLDEAEQLRTALESALEENVRLVDDRDRLLRRVTVLARELQTANSAFAYKQPPASLESDAVRDAHQSQTEEELRVAFEELQVLTEELEAANASLHDTNELLETRVEERTRAIAETNAALRRSEAAFRTLIEGIPQLAWRSLPGGEWTWSSPQWRAYTGCTTQESLGKGWLEALHPDDREAAQTAWDKAEAARPLEFEARIHHAGEGRYRHFRARAAPMIGEDGKIVEWLGTLTDVDDIVQLQQRQTILIDELQHRTRNLLAVVQAVTLRTIKGSASLAEFRSAIDARMQALAQGLLSRRAQANVTFDALILEELSAHVELVGQGNARQVSTEGPRGVPLQSANVQTLALALHELATNATKYGALSTPSGHLSVRWQVLGEPTAPRLRIEWIESGVEDVPKADAAAQGGGYGRELIERALPYQLGAQTTYHFASDGVHCTIEVAVPANDAKRKSQQ